MSNIGKIDSGYIYKTTNLANGKIYIGKHNRESFDEKYYGSGTMLKRAITKYGIDNFSVEIIDWYSTPDEQVTLERKYIRDFNSTDNSIGYNISEGGEGGDPTKGMSPEQYAQWINNLSESHKGYVHSEEWKQKMSERFKGTNNPAYGRPGSNTGKKFTDSHRTKISNALKGVKQGSRSMNCYDLFDGEYKVCEFRGLGEVERYMKKNNIPRGAYRGSIDHQCAFKELNPGRNQHQKITFEAMKKYPNYIIKKRRYRDNTDN